MRRREKANICCTPSDVDHHIHSVTEFTAHSHWIEVGVCLRENKNGIITVRLNCRQLNKVIDRAAEKCLTVVVEYIFNEMIH